MNRFLSSLVMAVAGLLAVPATVNAASPVEAQDTVTASDAFVRMPANTLDLLSTSMRLDMLEYLRHDSIYQVPNVMEGLSCFNPPVTADYLQVQVTPVTRFTIRVLPGKKSPVIATSYTVGDSLQASDSELRFFTPEMKHIKLDKIIKLASSEDFLDRRGLDRKQRDELLYLIPFPTVEYTFDPVSTDLKATLTVGEFLGKEDNEKLAPYLRRERTYKWDGHRYKLEKAPWE